VVWFGARSFWGHLRHFAASAIAAENIDWRAWMSADDPGTLLGRIATVLGGDPRGTTLVEALGRDVFIDFVADTGDDVSVSRAVARLVFASYELPDPDHPGQFLEAGRGDILLFGGDTAYPVATAVEIRNRVIAPWNQVLQTLPHDGRARVLLGVPGNHDWYDGLDGFGRMFRRRSADATPPALDVSAQWPEDRAAEWARELVLGGTIDKPDALVLAGYTPVQSASYFALSLAPRLELLAVDRQLTTVDARQRQLLGDRYRDHPDAATLVLLPDPVFHFGVPSRTGKQMVEKLGLDLLNRETFVLTGDIHHYERLERDKMMQVIAGGGGSFLHPARIAAGGLPPTVVWPGVAQCRFLLRGVPWKLAVGRSGFLPHVALAILFLLAHLFSGRLFAYTGLVVSASVLVTLLAGGIYAFIGGVVRRPSVLPLAVVAAIVTALVPVTGAYLTRQALEWLGTSAPALLIALGALVLAAFGGTFVFGIYLTLLTLLGYENMQAFTVLDHPGFKHFVRLRLRADGRGIDGWCIGVLDPLGPVGRLPVLVDQFQWRPFREEK
jgi:hypothetical protein